MKVQVDEKVKVRKLKWKGHNGRSECASEYEGLKPRKQVGEEHGTGRRIGKRLSRQKTRS